MRILHVIPSLSPSQGGPSYAMPLIARSLVKQGVDVTVATTDDDGPGNRLGVPLGRLVSLSGHKIIYFRKQTEFYKFSWPLFRWLLDHARDYDLLYIHALFSFSSTAAAFAARLADVPYIVRPLGVLNHWGFEHRRRLLKRLSFSLLEAPAIRHAAALHFTSEAEKLQAIKAGVRSRHFVIPLGIDLESFLKEAEPTLFRATFSELRDKRFILFLSRIDPKKGLDLLLHAFSQLVSTNPDLRLVIAGAGEPKYRSELDSLAARLGIAKFIVWTGHLEGATKRSALACADVYVLPSHSENFGIAAVEALAAGAPCILTRGVAIAEDVATKGGCLMVDADGGQIAEALKRLLSDPGSTLELSRIGKHVAKELFSLDTMGRRLVEACSRFIPNA